MLKPEKENPKNEIPEFKVTDPGIYIKMFHGRNNPDTDLEDWGFEGPLIGPLESVQFTYGHMRIHFKDSVPDKHVRKVLGLNTTEKLSDYQLEQHEDLIVWNGMYFGDMTIKYMTPTPETNDEIFKYYIESITAQFFDSVEIERSSGQIKQPGWYWADKDNNYRYGDWTGPFTTKKEALEAGKKTRTNIAKKHYMKGIMLVK